MLNLQFDLVPSTDMATKVSLVMSSGSNLPDVLLSSLSSAQVARFPRNDRVIIPVDKYYENSSYYLKPGVERVLEEKGFDVLKYVRAAERLIRIPVPEYQESLQNEFTGSAVDLQAVAG